MALPNITAQNNALNSSLYQTQQNAHAAGEQIHQLSLSLMQYVKAGFGLSTTHFFEQASSWALKQIRGQNDMILNAKALLVQNKLMLGSVKAQLDYMRVSGLFTQEQIKEQEAIVRWLREETTLTRSQIKFRTQIKELIEKQGVLTIGAVTYLLLLRDAWKHTLDTVHEYNRAFITANSDARLRYGLIERTLTTQRMLGTATEDMAEAGRALIEHGNHLTPAYQNNLKLVVQMKQGLGVATQSAAEMVVIFSRQLKTAASEAADQVTRIAYNTGLAASKMAQYASELGKAMRLLGTGQAVSPAGVLASIGGIAGRVEAIGGSSQSIINLYRSMAQATGTGLQARGLAGALNANIGTEGGAFAAMKGVADAVERIARAKNPVMYAQQLSVLAEQFGMTQNELIDLVQVMKEWNTATNTSKTLEQAYVDQTKLIGESWKQIKISLGTLLTQALMPFLRGFQYLISVLATAVKAVASFTIYGWNPLATILMVTLPAVAIVATIALVRLGNEIIKFALKSKFASAWLQGMGVSGFGKYLPTLPGSAALPWTRLLGLAIGWTILLGAIALAADQIHKAFIDMRVAQEKEKQTRFDLLRQQTSFTKLALDKAISLQTNLKATPAEREAATKKAIEMLLKEPRKQPWTPEEARQMIMRRSAEEEKRLARLEEYRGVSIKSKEEMENAQAMRLRIQQLEQQVKANEHAAKQATEDRRRFQWQVDLAHKIEQTNYWQLTRPDQYSNLPAYSPP